MALSLSDIRTEVKENCHNDTGVSDAQYNRWINRAQDDVEQRFLSRYLRQKSNIATAADISEYTVIEANFRSFIQFWQTDTPHQLFVMGYFTHVAVDPDPTSSGKPLVVIFLGFTSGFPTILLDPIPDAIYTIHYEFYENLPDLSNDTDISLISQLGWDHLLINGATKRYYNIHSTEDAIIWNQLFEQGIREFKEEWKGVNRVSNLRDIINRGGVAPLLVPKFPITES